MSDIRIIRDEQNRVLKIISKKYRRHYYSNGMLESIYYINNKCPHLVSRKKYPAKIFYRKDGTVHASIYSDGDFGGLHRFDGPAIHNGNNFDNQWWYGNKDYTLVINDWLEFNNVNWEEMKEDDFNRMWMEILD